MSSSKPGTAAERPFPKIILGYLRSGLCYLLFIVSIFETASRLNCKARVAFASLTQVESLGQVVMNSTLASSACATGVFRRPSRRAPSLISVSNGYFGLAWSREWLPLAVCLRMSRGCFEVCKTIGLKSNFHSRRESLL